MLIILYRAHINIHDLLFVGEIHPVGTGCRALSSTISESEIRRNALSKEPKFVIGKVVSITSAYDHPASSTTPLTSSSTDYQEYEIHFEAKPWKYILQSAKKSDAHDAHAFYVSILCSQLLFNSRKTEGSNDIGIESEDHNSNQITPSTMIVLDQYHSSPFILTSTSAASSSTTSNSINAIRISSQESNSEKQEATEEESNSSSNVFNLPPKPPKKGKKNRKQHQQENTISNNSHSDVDDSINSEYNISKTAISSPRHYIKRRKSNCQSQSYDSDSSGGCLVSGADSSDDYFDPHNNSNNTNSNCDHIALGIPIMSSFASPGGDHIQYWEMLEKGSFLLDELQVFDEEDREPTTVTGTSIGSDEVI
jgi:hypothetical protein